MKVFHVAKPLVVRIVADRGGGRGLMVASQVRLLKMKQTKTN